MYMKEFTILRAKLNAGILSVLLIEFTKNLIYYIQKLNLLRSSSNQLHVVNKK